MESVLFTYFSIYKYGCLAALAASLFFMMVSRLSKGDKSLDKIRLNDIAFVLLFTLCSWLSIIFFITIIFGQIKKGE